MKKSLVLTFSRQIAAGLVFLVAAQMSEAAVLPLQQEPQSQSTPTQQSQPAQQTQPVQAEGDQQTSKPDLPPAPDATGQQNQDQPAPAFASRSQDAQPQDAQKPVGTAAGPYTRPSGVAGSRPSGAAIAPAKQKHVKAIWIRVSLIVAGAAAAGAVIGLSKESPSRPQ